MIVYNVKRDAGRESEANFQLFYFLFFSLFNFFSFLLRPVWEKEVHYLWWVLHESWEREERERVMVENAKYSNSLEIPIFENMKGNVTFNRGKNVKKRHWKKQGEPFSTCFSIQREFFRKATIHSFSFTVYLSPIMQNFDKFILKNVHVWMQTIAFS